MLPMILFCLQWDEPSYYPLEHKLIFKFSKLEVKVTRMSKSRLVIGMFLSMWNTADRKLWFLCFNYLHTFTNFKIPCWSFVFTDFTVPILLLMFICFQFIWNLYTMTDPNFATNVSYSPTNSESAMMLQSFWPNVTTDIKGLKTVSQCIYYSRFLNK